MNETESNEAAKVRLAWVMAVTGYDPDAPEAPLAVRSLIAPPEPLTPRIRLAFRLLRLGLRLVPDGPNRAMLRHLLRHWQRRWYVT